ncbi:Hypothetical predicted protein [Octopus vulgaris]|uniref:Uncharacterized protein n=1 Tax=Octopus vulgaris TaxID=6645 RepID=A0AA36FD49_OCTVU|nr:Hypothetical predicted protein [Octopus vulgaris]
MVGVEKREVGVESREKSRQEEEGNSDGAVKDEEQERYTVNPDTVVGGHAGEMNQLDNDLLEIQRRLTGLMNAPEERIPMNMRRVDRSMMNKITQKINTVKPYIQAKETESKQEIFSALLVEKLQLKRTKNGGAKESWWKRRIKRDLMRARQDLGKIEQWLRGNWKMGKKTDR